MSATFSLVKGLVAAEKVIVSLHANKRFAESGLTTAEVEAGAATGIVVEDYPDYHKGPSVLVLQLDSIGRPVHVLWGIRKGSGEPAVIITAYRPDTEIWSPDFRSRK